MHIAKELRMDDLSTMMGRATLVAAICLYGHTTRLYRFPDGSWVIDRDDEPLGIWDHDNLTNCLEVFFEMAMGPPATSFALWLNLDEVLLKSSTCQVNRVGRWLN
jgi:hypothetical protein